MMPFLMAAAALAATADNSSLAGPADADTYQEVVVQGSRSDREWEMPKLEYDEPDSCPALVETQIPGFGTLRIRRSCAADRTEEWRHFQH